MEIDIKKALLKSALTLCGPMRPEITMRCNPTGIRIYTVSLDNTCLMDILLSDVTVNDEGSVGIDVKDMLEVLKTAGEDIHISVGDRMIVTSDGMRYTLPLIAPEEGDIRMPELETDSEVIVSSEHISRFLSAIPDKKGLIRVSFTEDGLVLSAEASHSIRGTELTIGKDDCVLCEGAARASYGADYLLDFIGAVSKGTELDMTMSDNFPLTAAFSEGGMRAKYILAPRIEDE